MFFNKLISLFKKEKSISIKVKPQRFTINHPVNDPTTPNLFERSQPSSSSLKFSVRNFNLSPKNTKELQALNCYITISNQINYVQSKSSNLIKNWAATPSLDINTLAGNDLNAYYDRRGLKFFYFTVPNKTIFTADSSDIVSHELGHALLDAIRPDFWNVSSLETWSFHEAFGDICALVNSMQHNVMLNNMLSETSNDISRSNATSRLAEEMGIAIFKYYNGSKRGSMPDSLRNPAVEIFKYVNPKMLPSEGLDNQLFAECHSFGKVFSSAWYRILVDIYKFESSKITPIDALKKARDAAFSIIIQAIPISANTVNYYSSIAKSMINITKIKYPEYASIVENVFFEWQILKNDTVKILSNTSWSDVVYRLKKDDKVIKNSNCTMVRKTDKKTIKLQGISSLSGPNLNNVEIEIPAESYYEFDNNGNLVDEILPNEEETLHSTMLCLNSIKNSLGSTWSIRNGKLIRNYISCDCRII